MLALSRSDVQRLVPMRLAVDLMKTVFADLSARKVNSPLRTPIEVPDKDAVSLFMPAFVPSVDGLGIKIVSVFPQNKSRNAPTIHAIVLLVRADTGEPLAILDGTFLTALRTGAVSGAATEIMSSPESRTLTCIGAGAQGVTQAWAVATVRPIERIFVSDVTPAAVQSFASRLAEYDPAAAALVQPPTPLHEALAQSDVICTATTSKQPVFDDRDLKPGAHINAVGAFTPEMQELPAAAVARSQLVVDAVDAALAEAGDLIIPIERGELSRHHVRVELGQLVSGDVAWNYDEKGISIFKSVGNAVQDVIVARRAVEEAQSSGIGQTVNL